MSDRPLFINVFINDSDVAGVSNNLTRSLHYMVLVIFSIGVIPSS